MDNSNKPLLFDKRVANEFEVFVEIIVGVYNTYELKWSNNFHYEFGFKYKITKNRSELFLGIWYEAWKHFQNPLCITVDYRGKAPIENFDRIKSFILSKNIHGLKVAFYNDFLVVLLDSDFFTFDPEGDDIERLGHLFDDIATFVERDI